MSAERPSTAGRVLFFVAVFAASMWPVYPVFSRIEPMVVGVPFSLVYLAGLGLLSFGGLLVLHRRDEREASRGSTDPEADC